ncbi:telomere-associated protein Tap [Kitasatospora sp. McL0602]|uniref:telomere-associated protein Tap n=1 Tax=Kitasatospora sp. McL0602 TaxID=3439530 RepID=UPI003F894C7F
MSKGIDPVEALLAQVDEEELPLPVERQRLRKAARLTRPQVADAVGVREETIWTWETGRSDPRPPQRAIYARLLRGLAERFPAPELPESPELTDVPVPELAAEAPQANAVAPAQLVMLDQNPDGSLLMAPPAPCVQCGQPSVYRAQGLPMHLGGFCRPAAVPVPAAPAAAPATAPAAAPVVAVRRPPSAPVPASRVRKAPAKKSADTTAPADWETAAAAKYPAGPLAVLDVAPDGAGVVAWFADGSVTGPAGQVGEVGRSLAEVVEWALTAKLGSPRLHRHGKDGDPLVVLTDAAAAELGLPKAGREKGDFDQRANRVPENHKVVKALTRAGWLLTQRGLGPWARVYRSPEGGGRECVQLCVPMWGALANGGWSIPDGLDAPGLARLLGTYAGRVLTPRGSTAVSGLELMTTLRPPTRAVRTESGWTSGWVEGSLHRAVDPAPPEAPDEHPVAEGREFGDVMDEEAWDWVRPLGSVADEERARPWAVGLDVNTAFLAAAGRLLVGLSEPVHELRPAFDKRIPGSWLVDLSGLELDPRLPNPFTPTGERPTGPAWYATPTVAYAVELGVQVGPLEGWLRHESGPYLDPWHKRLRQAYVDTMAALGVPLNLADEDPQRFLQAMAALKTHGDPVELAVLAAVKQTAKGGVGKLRERPRGQGYRPGQRWAALERPTWRPDIRAAVISTARVNFHRKLLRTAAHTGQFPLGVLSDCAVYAAPGPGALDVLPRTPDGRPVAGALRLGVSPGLVKFEGARPLPEVLELLADGVNPARHIKTGGTASSDE